MKFGARVSAIETRPTYSFRKPTYWTPSLLLIPRSNTSQNHLHCENQSYISPVSFSWNYFINTDASRKDIYHIDMKWKFADMLTNEQMTLAQFSIAGGLDVSLTEIIL